MKNAEGFKFMSHEAKRNQQQPNVNGNAMGNILYSANANPQRDLQPWSNLGATTNDADAKKDRTFSN